MICNGLLSFVCLVMGCFQYSPRLARVWLKRAPLTSDWTRWFIISMSKKSKSKLTTQAPIQFQSLLIPIQRMQICFNPNVLVTGRQLHRSAPTNNESECEQLPLTRVLSNCYAVPYRWWHDMVCSLCVHQCVCACARVCAWELTSCQMTWGTWLIIEFLNGGDESIRLTWTTSNTCESTACVCVGVIMCRSCLYLTAGDDDDEVKLKPTCFYP